MAASEPTVAVSQPPAAAARPSAGRGWLRLEHLYVLIPLVAIGVVAALTPTPPNDFWWHLRIGQRIVEEGRIPATTDFTWTLAPGTPYVYAWLAEWFFYQLYQVGGVALITFARNGLLLATLAVVALDANRRSGSWRLAGLAVAVAGTLSLNNVVVRPQNLSWLPFVLLPFLLHGVVERRLGPRWLALLPPLMLLWANAHGAFVLGLAIIGAYLVGETLSWLGREPTALPPGHLRALALAAVASLAATLLNPYGADLYASVRTMTNHPNQRWVVEWFHPTLEEPINRLFYLSIIGLLVVLARSPRRARPSELLLIGGFLWLAWSMQRSVTWYGLLIGPILAAHLARPTTAPRPATAERPALTLALALAIVAPLLLTQPWTAERLPLPDGLRARLHPPTPVGPLLAAETPIAAAEYLRANPGGRLFNENGFGSYLAWALPGQPLCCLPQMEVYPAALLDDYVNISRGQSVGQTLDRLGVDRLLLGLGDQPALARAMAELPGWRLEYADERSQIWRRAP